MSNLTNPSKVFLFASILYRKDLVDENEIISLWESKFGYSIRFKAPFCPMKKYYSPEMGEIEKLDRFFLLTDTLSEREILLQSKLWADEVERTHYHLEGKRTVNLDVGTISLENLQLATGKNFTHRVYIGNNIYSDLTLIYQGKSFNALPWSYPDYSSPEIIEFFNWARKLLHLKLQ